jgi:hypothetical protein
MTDQRLIEALSERAAADARAFREKFPGEEPNEKWMDNSFTAALPLAASDARTDIDSSAHPELFALYKSEVARSLGMTSAPRPDSESDRKRDAGQIQEPTRGEG